MPKEERNVVQKEMKIEFYGVLVYYIIKNTHTTKTTVNLISGVLEYIVLSCFL